jgi:predicted RNA-binding protein with PIN domain
MIIIVDGYNLLKQLYPNSKENLENHKKNLVRQLGIYRKIKKESIKDIIVVYDGGGFAHALRSVHHGVAVLESGYKQSADDWIIEYAQRYKNSDVTIVTMDRALYTACAQFGSCSMSVFDFMRAVNLIIQENNTTTIEAYEPVDTVVKFEDPNMQTDFDIPQNHGNLDSLMNQGALMKTPHKTHEGKQPAKRNDAQLSKQDKLMLKKLKKIY